MRVVPMIAAVLVLVGCGGTDPKPTTAATPTPGDTTFLQAFDVDELDGRTSCEAAIEELRDDPAVPSELAKQIRAHPELVNCGSSTTEVPVSAP